MPDEHYAHTLEGAGPDQWQPLREHLDNVSELASRHAAGFGSAAWGALAGRWHDLGKYADDFQGYLRASARDTGVVDASVEDARKGGRVDHSTAGAVLVYERCAGRLVGKNRDELPAAAAALAMVIAGHHGGLPARLNFEGEGLTKGEKRARLERARDGGRAAPAELLGLDLPPPPDFLRPEEFRKITDPKQKKRTFDLRHELWTRMLLSALVDADRLDTEAFMDRKKAALRGRSRRSFGSLVELLRRLDGHLDAVARGARGRAGSLSDGARERAEAVLGLRADVLAACRAAADRPPGRYTLTVPTGGGKTLAALAFALAHAIRRDLRRVIVVIPFTSIIDQTAAVYREAFGDELVGSVIEHHSNLDPAEETYHNRLASENWDAPVIVTTSVQFFESLFARRGTALRKLHNIARSVVVFDEVQTLPHHLRAPIVDVLNQLVDHYGISALFCTATQPALDLEAVGRVAFPHLAGIQEIGPPVTAAYATVKDRVEATFPSTEAASSWEQLAAEVAGHDRVLAIVHRRQDARDLWGLLPEGTFHLSALMSAAHRRQVLAEIVATLTAGEPCRVVSTTLVEAGVDLDFPVVYRALGGVDAMAQAAGRCNREGRLADAEGRPVPGRLILFRAPTDPPPGLQLGKSTTETLLRGNGRIDLFGPETYKTYFREYFASRDPDGNQVMGAREALDFPVVEERFRMIEDEGRQAVVVPFGAAESRIAAYRADPGRRTLRALQPFLVTVSPRALAVLSRAHLIETIHEQVHWLRPAGPDQYHPSFGLDIDRIAPADPRHLIA